MRTVKFLSFAMATAKKGRPARSRTRPRDFTISSRTLDQCQVLIWWGHVRQGLIKPRQGQEIVRRIRAGKLSLIAMHSAPDVPDERFSAMTRLDQNRAQAQLAAAQSQLAVSRAAYERVTGNPPATLQDPPARPDLPDHLADAAEKVVAAAG